MNYFLLILISMTMLLYGGFFAFVSCILNIVLGIAVLYKTARNKRFIIPLNMEFLVITIIVIMYGVSTFWAVDSGMAFVGLLKYMPLFLLFIYIYQNDTLKKEEIIAYIPVAASVMVIVSLVFSIIPATKEFVLVNGRLSGFLQYPNTFAMLLLVCLIILFFKENKKKYIDICCALICCLGIVLSKSLAVWCLSLVLALSFICLWLYNNSNKKRLIIVAVTVLGAIIITFIVLICSGIINQIIDVSLKVSTFWGRILYTFDSIKIIKDNPFGLGYYGYKFIQGKYQTGVYSVANVHNDFVQLILDVGIVPGVLFTGVFIKQIFSKKQSVRNKFIFIFMLLHGMFDYDLEFLLMGMILVILIPEGNKKIIKGYIMLLPEIVAFIVLTICSVKIGGSELFGSCGMYEVSEKFYNKNTQIKLKELEETDDLEDKLFIAEDILYYNKYSSECYDVKWQYAYSQGNVDDIITYARKAIEIQPYNNERINAYVDRLCECTQYFLDENYTEGADICISNIENAVKIMNTLEDRTSRLGWMIQDKPVTSLDDEINNKVNILSEEYSNYGR